MFYPSDGDFCVHNVGYDNFAHVKEISSFRKQPFYTLHYIAQGEGYLHFRGQTYTLSEGQYFLLPPDEDFKYHPNKNNPWLYFWFGFQGAPARGYFEELYKDSPIISNLPSEDSYALFKGLFSEIAANGTAKYYSVLSCFFGVLNRLSQEPAKTEKIPFVDTAKQFMELNYQSAEFNVNVLCRMIHVSHSYLCKIFKREEGCTVKSYLDSLRMSDARKLLSDTDISVKEIAFRIGFVDEINFMKAFKKHHGCTPSAFREKQKN